jgi:hypothetical protein
MLCLLLVGRKEEREREKKEKQMGRFFSPHGQTCFPAWDFCSC